MLAYWVTVFRTALVNTRTFMRSNFGPIASIVSLALAGVLGVWCFGANESWKDDAYNLFAVLIFVVAFAVIWFLCELVVLQARLDGKKSERITFLEKKLETREQADSSGQMPLKELALHLQGLVGRFAKISDWEERFDSMDVAVRDALSLGSTAATGRPKDWTNEFTQRHEARSEILRDFWQKPQRRIDWLSLGSDDTYRRATAVNDRGDVEFYDLGFDPVSVHRLWPPDYFGPISIAELAGLAQLFLGYDFETERSHSLSLIGGIRQSASLGTLKIMALFVPCMGIDLDRCS